MNVWLATEIVPLRADPVFAATVKLTVPVPEAPAVIQVASLVAVHEQGDVVVTVILAPAPPLAPAGGDVHRQNRDVECELFRVTVTVVHQPD